MPVFLIRIFNDDFLREINKQSLLFIAVSMPKDGEDINGDGYDIEFLNYGAVLLLVDGLGDRISANEASNEAIKIFKNYFMKNL